MQRRLMHRGHQKLVVGAEGDAEMRARPFENFGLGRPCWETTASRHCNARSRAAGPSARTQARRQSRARRTIFPRPCRCGRRRSCRRTTPPRRRDGARHCRSSAVWRRSRAPSTSPLASSATTLPSSPPVTMRAPSEAAHRMPPPCTATCEISPSPATSSTFSSAPTKAARSPRKYTDDDRHADRDRAHPSVTETMEARLARIEIVSSRGDTALEAVADHLFRQFAADEDEAALALLVLLPSRWWSPSSIMCTPWNT